MEATTTTTTSPTIEQIKLSNTTINICVVGRISVGKTTFVSCLVGEQAGEIKMARSTVQYRVFDESRSQPIRNIGCARLLNFTIIDSIGFDDVALDEENHRIINALKPDIDLFIVLLDVKLCLNSASEVALLELVGRDTHKVVVLNHFDEPDDDEYKHNRESIAAQLIDQGYVADESHIVPMSSKNVFAVLNLAPRNDVMKRHARALRNGWTGKSDDDILCMFGWHSLQAAIFCELVDNFASVFERKLDRVFASFTIKDNLSGLTNVVRVFSEIDSHELQSVLRERVKQECRKHVAQEQLNVIEACEFFNTNPFRRYIDGITLDDVVASCTWIIPADCDDAIWFEFESMNVTNQRCIVESYLRGTQSDGTIYYDVHALKNADVFNFANDDDPFLKSRLRDVSNAFPSSVGLVSGVCDVLLHGGYNGFEFFEVLRFMERHAAVIVENEMQDMCLDVISYIVFALSMNKHASFDQFAFYSRITRPQQAGGSESYATDLRALCGCVSLYTIQHPHVIRHCQEMGIVTVTRTGFRLELAADRIRDMYHDFETTLSNLFSKTLMVGNHKSRARFTEN